VSSQIVSISYILTYFLAVYQGGSIKTLSLIQQQIQTPSSVLIEREALKRGLTVEVTSPQQLCDSFFNREQLGILLRTTGIDYCDQDLNFFMKADQNCPIHSSPAAMLKLRGKSQQEIFFKNSHLPHPKTFSLDQAILGDGPFLVKPERSLKGLGQVYILGQQSLLSLIQALKVWKDERFIVQLYHPKKCEWRFFFCLDDLSKPAVLKKSGEHWQGNRGHQTEEVIPLHQVPSALMAQAKRCFEASKLSYAGIDIIETLEGEWLFLEVNAVPGFQSFQERNIDIAARIVNLFY